MISYMHSFLSEMRFQQLEASRPGPVGPVGPVGLVQSGPVQVLQFLQLMTLMWDLYNLNSFAAVFSLHLSSFIILILTRMTPEPLTPLVTGSHSNIDPEEHPW